MLKTKERIITTADLGRDPAQALQNAQRAPIVVTAEGKPAAYLVGTDTFDALIERLIELEREELSVNVQRGEQDFVKGNFSTLQEVIARAEARWQDQDQTQP
jgi:prevent-host-death family protein